MSIQTARTEGLTQAERTAISDRAMIEAAIELILEHGADKATLAAIGEKAGYSRGLATYRFGSKAGLLDAVCKSVSRRWLEYLKKGVGRARGIDAMCAALDAFLEFVAAQPRDARVLHILYCGAANPGSEYRRTSVNIHRRQLDDVLSWIREGQEAGTIRADVDAKSTAANYIAYIFGMTYLWLIDPETVDCRRANEDMKRQLRRVLMPSAGGESGCPHG